MLDQSFIAQQAELERLGFKILEAERNTLIASRRSFYWDCILTFVNYTVFVQRVTTLSAEMILSDRDRLISESKQINRSSLPRGMQSGNAVLVVYVADRVNPDAQELCERQGRLGFAQFYVPAALDLNQNAAFLIRKTPIWGAVYYSKFRYVLARLLSPQGTPNQEPLSTSGIILLVLTVLPLLLIAILFLVLLMR